jgi:dephospho-CoA kinase
MVRRLLSEAGVATIDADAIGHSVLEPDGAAHREVAERWPQVVVDDVIDRKSLAEIVFADPAQPAELETMTHPHIFDTIRGRVEESEGDVVVEIPLTRHGLGETWHRIIVDSKDDVRLARAIGRGMDEEDARRRMAAQPSRAQWLALADLVIPNHGDLTDLESAVGAAVPALTR